MWSQNAAKIQVAIILVAVVACSDGSSLSPSPRENVLGRMSMPWTFLWAPGAPSTVYISWGFADRNRGRSLGPWDLVIFDSLPITTGDDGRQFEFAGADENRLRVVTARFRDRVDGTMQYRAALQDTMPFRNLRDNSRKAWIGPESAFFGERGIHYAEVAGWDIARIVLVVDSVRFDSLPQDPYHVGNWTKMNLVLHILFYGTLRDR